MGRYASRLEADDDAGVLGGLPRHDALDESARLDGLGLDDQAPMLDAAQHEEVLDEPVQALGLGAHVREQGRARVGVVRCVRAA